MGSPEFDRQLGPQDARSRANGAMPGKATLIEAELARAIPLARLDVCPEYPPRQPSLLDDLLPRDKADLERRIAIATVRANELVIGALPLGGVFMGKREHYRVAIEVDRAEIGMRTLSAHTTVLGAIAGSILRLRGAPDVTIMQGAEAGAAIEGVIGALSRRGPAPTLTKSPPGATKRPPIATKPPRAGTTRRRKRSLIDDLKRRSVHTMLDGTPNPRFDPNTPSHIAHHFKREQMRSRSNSPRNWNNPEGYEAFAKYGEPPGTRLHWGTIEDNGHLQGPREMGNAPQKPPKPLP